MRLTQLFIFICLLLSESLFSYNLRQISSKEGLSNSAILSLAQNRQGYILAGSCDGLNVLENQEIRILKPNEHADNTLSGNMIHDFLETNKGITWIRTNYGLNKMDEHYRIVAHYYSFLREYKMTYDPERTQENLILLQKDRKITYYLPDKDEFVEYPTTSYYYDHLYDAHIIDQQLWICDNNGIHCYQTEYNDNCLSLKAVETKSKKLSLQYASHEDSLFYLIDTQGALSLFDPKQQCLQFVCNLDSLIRIHGEIASIAHYNGDYFIAFTANGMVKLNRQHNYRHEPIDIHCGVFALLKDKNQPILWVATDGQGVYRYSEDQYAFHSVTFDQMPIPLSKPIRAIYTDREQNLWIGTKSDGIVQLDDYTPRKRLTTSNTRLWNNKNSDLQNNSVYAFAASNRNLFWIGHDGPGLAYYSYHDHRIHALSNLRQPTIRYVHAIHESNDTTLWLATLGQGVFKVTLDPQSKEPAIKEVKQLLYNKQQDYLNHFFCIYQESDSIIWFGNRGAGLVRMNTDTENYMFLYLQTEKISPVNDIFTIYQHQRKNLYIGTGNGLVELSSTLTKNQTFTNINQDFGSFNNTIHGILEDSRSTLWLSTNRGIIQYDPELQKPITYTNSAGLEIIEFSDGAYFKDPVQNILYFGGTNGFVTIGEGNVTDSASAYMPPVIFKEIRLHEKTFAINDLLEHATLTLKHHQNFFNITFSTLDYLYSDTYLYDYMLEGSNETWFRNGNSNKITFTNLSPGKYKLHIKYKSKNIDQSPVYTLPIVILPAWYQSKAAYVGYFILFIAIIIVGIGFLIKREQKRRKGLYEKMEKEKREAVYESKLRFFTNITHELCTPLTLIAGPCERILQYDKSDGFIKKYATLIQRNVYRMNELIQDLIEFRRIETENRRFTFEKLPISAIVQEICDSFNETASSKEITFTTEFVPDITWGCDKKALVTIVTNLISNAFKYTPTQGVITFSVTIELEMLCIRVKNTGKGIKHDEIDRIFDRYRILDNLEKQSLKGISAQNGLGLAICYNLVKLLQGEIKAESTPDIETIFTVKLPPQHVRTSDDTEKPFVPETLKAQTLSLPLSLPDAEQTIDKHKETLFIIDDDKEMAWFISELFNDKYNVVVLNDPTLLREKLTLLHPQLIISDIRMTPIDGIELTRHIKTDKQTAHIPVILLSANQAVDYKIKGIESGADLYLTKPFDVQYLKTTVDNLIKRNSSLKEYYESSRSSFEMTEGKMLHKEEKQFLDTLLDIIDKNLTNNISAQFLADEMGTSLRNFYRKLAAITDQTPLAFVKEYRLNAAVQMITKTNLSIDEIMYKSGFGNRSSFYKAFSAKYGCTPKKYREQQQEEVKKNRTKTD